MFPPPVKYSPNLLPLPCRMPNIRRYLFVALLLAVVSLNGCGVVHNKPEPAKKAWTLMFYLDADEQAIQQDMIAAFTEMMTREVGSTGDVNVVIQFDRYPTDPAFGGWTTTHRFYYIAGMAPTPEAAIKDWGDGQGGREVNMADPNTLSTFISWAEDNYPAKHYALIPVDHGYGWQGLNIDMTSKGEFMSVKDFAAALSSSPARIDLLGLDACLMAGAEVLHELRNCPVDTLVASENSGTTWPLADIIKTVTSNPDINTEDLGHAINDLYAGYHAADPSITLSTLRLNKAAALTASIKGMADAISSGSPLADIRSRARTVMSSITDTVAYHVNGANWPSAEGITVYWPRSNMGFIPNEFFYSYIDQTVAFATDAGWRDMLFIYYTPLDNPGVIPQEIYDTRNGITGFDDDTKVDLYDFCRRLAGP